MPKRKEKNKPKAVNSEWEDKTSVLWHSNCPEDETVDAETCISKLGLAEIHRSTEPDDNLDEQIKAYIHQRLELEEPGEARLEGLQSLVRQAREQVSQSKQYLHKTHDALEKKVEKLHTYTQAPQGWLVDLCSLHKEILLHLSPTFPAEDPCAEVRAAARETLLLQLSVDELHVPPRLIVTEIRARKLDSGGTRDGESRPKAEKVGEKVLTHSGAGGSKEAQASASEIGAVQDDLQLSSAKAEGNKKMQSSSTKRVSGKGSKSSALNRATTKESISPLATKPLANNKPGSSHADLITGSDSQSPSSKRVPGKESGSSSTKQATSMESQSPSVKRGSRREPHLSAVDEVVTNKPGSSDGDQFTSKKNVSSLKRITAGESVSMSTKRLTPVESQTSSLERVTTKESSSPWAFLKSCPCPKDSWVNGCSSPAVSATEVASDAAASAISFSGASSASVLVAPHSFTQDCLGHNKTRNARQNSTISLIQHFLECTEETQNPKDEEKRLCHTSEQLNIDLNSGHTKPSHEHPYTISSSIDKPRTSKTHKDVLAASNERLDMRVVRVSKEALIPESGEKRVSIQGHYLSADSKEPLRFMIFLYRDERPDTEILTGSKTTALCGTYVRDMLTTKKRLRWKFRHEF